MNEKNRILVYHFYAKFPEAYQKIRYQIQRGFVQRTLINCHARYGVKTKAGVDSKLSLFNNIFLTIFSFNLSILHKFVIILLKLSFKTLFEKLLLFQIFLGTINL